MRKAPIESLAQEVKVLREQIIESALISALDEVSAKRKLSPERRQEILDYLLKPSPFPAKPADGVKAAAAVA